MGVSARAAQPSVTCDQDITCYCLPWGHGWAEERMTPADDSGAGTAGRAETYLRLLAETELRRGIALPRYQPPGPPELPPPVYSALRAVAPVAARAAQAWTPTARRAFLVSLRTGRRLARRHVGYGRAPAEKGVDRVRAVASAL